MDGGTSQQTHLPTGTVTFLLTDVRDSPELREAIERRGGVCQPERGGGGGILGVFDRTSDAVVAALGMQQETEPRPRMAVHAAEAHVTDRGEYVGTGVGRCARLRAIAHEGQVLLSRSAHDLVIDALPADVTLVDLGTHQLADLGRPEQVFGLAHAGLPDPVAPAPQDPTVPRNLPPQLTSFVGRERELAELDAILGDARLVTLTGAGGCGKTRLALRAVMDLLDRYPDGVWWVDLAPVADQGLVGAAIAEPLGVRPLPGMTELQAACALLASRSALVLLDNCEHLLEASAEAAGALVQAGEGITVLATSRVPLGAPGEVEWRVPSLSLPRPGKSESVDWIASDAVRLFIERAVGSRPGFAVTGDNSAAVTQICTDLDGIPLAIELAAARIRMLSVEQVADGLADQLRVLGGGADSAPPRQQTLRASVDWSYELLAPEEQALLRRLAVFAGGCNLEAVEQVCAGDGVDPHDVLDLLGSLVDKSLVVAEERGPEMRYRQLETVRQYSGERLRESGQGDATRDSHRDYFLALAERAAPELEREGHRKWHETLDPEGANLLAAIERAADTRPGLALRICAALFLWWRGARLWAEAESAIARSLGAAEAEPAGPRAAVLWTRGFFAVGAGRLEAAREHGTEALALAREAGDASIEARALNVLGVGEMYAAPAAGRASLQRALDLARAERDDYVQIEASDFLAFSYLFQDDHEQIARVLDEAAAAGVPREGMGQAARYALIRASVALLDGRLPEARETLAAALAAEDSGDEPVVEAWNDAQVALLDMLEGRPEQALERLMARLDHVIETGAGLSIPALLTWASWAEIGSGRFEEARQRLEVVIPIVDGRDCLLSLWANWHMAEALRLLGDEGAVAAAERTRELGREVGNPFAGSRGDMTLARLASARGDWTVAEQHALTHLDVVVEGGHLTFVPHCFDALAEVAAGLESHEEAVRLLAAGERARADLGIARWTPEADHWAAIEGGLREALGDDEFDAAWAAGMELSIDEAGGWARRARGSRKRPPSGWESLTPTEVQVVELAAQGLTNPQIGERMFISRATVKSHLAHIFQKLDVRNRADLAAKAARRDT